MSSSYFVIGQTSGHGGIDKLSISEASMHEKSFNLPDVLGNFVSTSRIVIDGVLIKNSMVKLVHDLVSPPLMNSRRKSRL